MLQAYVDDSASRDPPVFVLAGYVSTAKQWSLFAQDWQKVLDMRPRLAYLKMSEAAASRGEFEGMSDELRDERLRIFYATIEHHVMAEFCLMVPPDALRRVFGDHDHYGRNPFFFSAGELMLLITRNLKNLHLPQEPIDFIFDTSLTEKPILLEGWEFARSRAKPVPTNLFEIFKNPPTFRDDKDVLPLQAADMYAWWMRRKFQERIGGLERREYPWTVKRDIRGVISEFTEQNLKEIFWSALSVTAPVTGRFRPWTIARAHFSYGTLPPIVADHS
jgi:hypothetical protein